MRALLLAPCVVLAEALCSFAAMGCSGETRTGDDAGDAGDAGSDFEAPDAGIDVSTGLPCPRSVPTTGSPCTLPAGFVCEYGSGYDSCSSVFRYCSNDGLWAFYSDGGHCVDQSSCPPSYAEAADGGQNCFVIAFCEYPDGVCVCSGGCTLPVSPPAECRPYPPGCPLPRPRYGDPCTQEGQLCNYQPCMVMTCRGGFWQE